MSKRKAQRQRTLTDKGGIEILRFFGEMPVVDATHDLRVIIEPCDLAAANRKDPTSRVFARACQRLFKSSKVLFFRSVAYVDLPKEDGTRHIERFRMPPSMRGLIEQFDRGEETIPAAGFLLKAPTGTQTLEGVLARSRKNNQRRRDAKLLGRMERRGDQGLGAYQDKPIAIDLAVRSGVGAVHFTLAKSKKRRRAKERARAFESEGARPLLLNYHS